MRRLACIGDWRIEVLALHGANRTRDVAVAWVRDTLQGGGKAERGATLPARTASGLAAAKTAVI